MKTIQSPDEHDALSDRLPYEVHLVERSTVEFHC